MVDKVINTIKKYSMLENGDKVLVALSGGVDSSVLLDVLVRCSEALGITVCAAHLNHMLRGADADDDEQFVRDKCSKYGVPLICEKKDIASIARESGQSTETCARNVRYDFLRRAAKELGAVKIATAHNANDGLETVIFNLARGGGTDALCGIPPVRDDIIRPLTEIPREDIEEYARAFQISYCTDKTNAETIYSRNKIRHNIIPEMLKINSAAVRNAVRSAQIVREEARLLRELAVREAERIADCSTACGRRELASVDCALFARVCEYFAKNASGDIEYTLEQRHISDIRALCENQSPSARIYLPRNVCVRCEYEKIVFEKTEATEPLQPVKVAEGEMRFGKYVIRAKKTKKTEKIHNSVNTFLIPCDRIQNGLIVRTRKSGDGIKLPKRPGKSLKKLFIEEKLPKHIRETVPVIADGNEVFAVCFFGQDERTLPQSGQDIVMIEIRCGESEE